MGALAAAAALLLAACGGSSASSPSSAASSSGSSGGSAGQSGKEIFASAGCGQCHTLKAAGSTGGIGPNLDQIKPSQSDVAQQVQSGGGGMPSFADKLSQAQITAVAQFVASSAG